MNQKILLSRLFQSAIMVGIFFLSYSVQSQVTKTSVGNGNWEEIEWSPAGVPATIDDATVNTSVTIPLGTTVEVQNLHLDANAQLQVDGNLIVYGNVTMANNSPEFGMGPSAVVVVHGDFIASNKINIAVSSYLIIYGSFIKDGSTNQGDLDVDDGNIYIFGEVDEDWGLSTCEEEGYDGTTENTGGTCDYGAEEDFEENQDLIPDELKQLISCFKISKIPDVTTCEFTNAVFEVDQVENVTYEWQEKGPDGIWSPTGDNTNVLTLPGVTTTMSGNQYRVVLRPTIDNEGNCRVAFSNTAVLNVDAADFLPGTISGETTICLPASGELTYSIEDYGEGFSYEWILPNGWTFSNPEASNASSVDVLPEYVSGTNLIKVIVSNTCGQQEFQLLVSMAVTGEWTGYADSDWNSPANWGCGIIPDLTTTVTIPDGLNNYPDTNSGPPAMTSDLSIAVNASLIVNNNNLHIGGTINNSGTLNAVSGSVTLTGTTQQEIPVGTFEFDRIQNLTLDNAAGLLLSGPLEVTGTVLAANGDIQSAGNLKLISDATQTALIDGSGTGEIIGSVSIQRYMDAAFGYKYFSSPFKNITVGDFSPYLDLLDPITGFPHFYRYNENRQDTNGNDATGWEAYTNETDLLGVGAGYALNFGNQTGVTVQISGEVNNGPVTLTLQNSGGDYTKGFHLVGNPYPSPIDWNAPGWEKTNIDDAVYFFTSGSTQYTGTYSSFVNGVSSEDIRSSNVIPSMQGFFVKVSEPQTAGNYPVAGSLGMDNSVRITDFDQQFLKSRKETPKPLLRLTASFQDEEKSDALVVYFPAFAVENFEKDKGALKLMNTDERVPNFYSLTPNAQKLSINALPLIKNKKIPLGVSAKKSGRMWIELSTKNNLPSGTEVYLLDLENNILQSLENKSGYEFNITAGEHNSRFELLLSDRILTDPSEAFIQPLNVFSEAGILKIQIAVEKDRQGILSISSLSGQVLQTRKVSGDDYLEYNDLPNSGVYIVSLKLADRRYSKKVIIRK